MPPILDQAHRLSEAGRTAEAVALVGNAAQQGDPEALFALANWRLFGLHGPRDLAAANALLRRAIGAGHVEATRLLATLLGNGTIGSGASDEAAGLLRSIEKSDPYAALQLAFSATFPDTQSIARLRREHLSEAPDISCIRGFLSGRECDYLITLAKPHMRPSTVIDPRSGRRIPHPVRTSTGMSFGPTQEDRIVNLINQRIAQVTGTDVHCGEPLHILSYEAGQEYRPHVDALPGIDNQRYWTVLVYLNDCYKGGATRFEQVGIAFAGCRGDALIFRNVDLAGESDPLTRHAGLPVEKGEKWIATRWIRERPYHPWS